MVKVKLLPFWWTWSDTPLMLNIWPNQVPLNQRGTQSLSVLLLEPIHIFINNLQIISACGAGRTRASTRRPAGRTRASTRSPAGRTRVGAGLSYVLCWRGAVRLHLGRHEAARSGLVSLKDLLVLSVHPGRRRTNLFTSNRCLSQTSPVNSDVSSSLSRWRHTLCVTVPSVIHIVLPPSALSGGLLSVRQLERQLFKKKIMMSEVQMMKC